MQISLLKACAQSTGAKYNIQKSPYEQSPYCLITASNVFVNTLNVTKEKKKAYRRQYLLQKTSTQTYIKEHFCDLYVGEIVNFSPLSLQVSSKC